MGEKIRWLRLDGDEYEPFVSSDALGLRIDNGNNWRDRILDMVPDGPGWLKVATGRAGRWRFRRVPPIEYVNHRKLWIRESSDECTKVGHRRLRPQNFLNCWRRRMCQAVLRSVKSPRRENGWLLRMFADTDCFGFGWNKRLPGEKRSSNHGSKGGWN